MNSINQTFCAPATPPLNSSIAIVRINGPSSLETARSLFTKPEIIKPRKACYGSIMDGDRLIDDVVIIFYKAPHSYTGDDMVEIFCHGNQFILHRILRVLGDRGIRLAEPGEFSKRAFLNGKMDLTEAEAINHIITAKSDWEVDTALKQMHGSLREKVHDIRNNIILLKADIEAGIDFIEEDIEFVSRDESLSKADEITAMLSDLNLRCRTGQQLSRGIDITITGKPNVGKSSILNLILNQERAIVSPLPGTTRDMIRESVQINNIHINLIDTAGIDTPGDEIEKIGIEMSHKKIETASIVLFIIDATTGITAADRYIMQKIENKKSVFLLNKIDCVDPESCSFINELPARPIHFSAKTGQGLDILEKKITEILSNEFVDYRNSYIADLRVMDLLNKAIMIIKKTSDVIRDDEPPEIIASELQMLIDTLSEITGEISPDDVLGSIFSRFCIGK